MLSIFEKIWSMSITASVVIGIVLLARLLLKRSPKWISYALWSVVLFRLLCPVSVHSSLSIIPEPVLDTKAPEVSFDIPAAKNPDTEQLNSEQILSIPQDIPVENLILSDHVTLTPSAGLIRPVQPVKPAQEETFRFPVEWVWFAGVALLAVVSVIRYALLRRKLRCCVHFRENIFLADGIPTAFVMGLLRPKIYLPSSLGEGEWDYVLAHERCHIRRMDPLIRLLSFSALCVHWFNPLVWLAFYLAGQDMEMSCDEAVLKQLGEEIRKDYSQSLLNLSAGRSFAFTPLAFGEGDTGKRIRNLSKWKKPVLWIAAIAVILSVILAICLLTNPSKVETVSVSSGSVYTWFDYDHPSHIPKNQKFEIQIEEIPGVTFRWRNGILFVVEGIRAEKWSETEFPSSIYFSDLNGDGCPELCMECSLELNCVSDHVVVYDYAAKKEYRLSQDVRYISSIWEFDGSLSHLCARMEYYDGSIPAKEGTLWMIPDPDNGWRLEIADIADILNQVTLPPTEVTIPEGEFSYPFYGFPAEELKRDGKDFVSVTVRYSGRPEVTYTWNRGGFLKMESAGKVNYLYLSDESDEQQVLHSADQVFLADLNGDGYPELCSAGSFGSGIIDSHVVIYDFADGQKYTLWDRMQYDYYLSMVDGVLWARKTPYRQWGEEREADVYGPLVLQQQGDKLVPVILQPWERLYEMTPTASTMIGGYDGYLFVTINGSTYRYQRHTIEPEGLTEDSYLGLYYENTVHSVDHRTVYRVYSTKEYTDYTVLLVEADGVWMSYRYAPAQRISEETWQKIRNTEGLVILEDGKAALGKEYFQAFYKKTQQGEACSIQTASYYTIDPDRMVDQLYQTMAEDYPRLYLHTLSYDGEKFTISWEENGSIITRQYSYLMCYTGTSPQQSTGNCQYIRYVLTNDNTVTWEDIFHGMFSSQMGAYIDHYTVYTDYIP